MTDVPGGGVGEVERYEQLRSRTLDGGPSGFTLGLALLQRCGVAAWARAWQAAAPVPEVDCGVAPVIEPPAASPDLVGVLASMALARVAEG